MTMLARCHFILFLSAVMLAGSLAPAHEATMGGMIGELFHDAAHAAHTSDVPDRNGTDEPCDICGMALTGDCMATFCHPELIVESHYPAARGLPGPHDPKATRNPRSMTAEVQTPPPRHLP